MSQPTVGSREAKSGKDRVRKEMLKLWFLTLREKGVKPIFAVTDKDVGQIGGIEETFPNTEVVDAELDPWLNFTSSTILVHDWNGEKFQAVDNVVHDWTGEEFQAIDDLPDTADVTDDYLQVFKEKWSKLVQNTEYLIEHDKERA
ncbi:hypothetical protein R1sor_009672 [Riccia sorocarpa]|uniref:Uncharacterized protein n=1 Tax=Riccia sorocarpa TaxID=122646 RepID=A0ABD3HXA0_9MARC